MQVKDIIQEEEKNLISSFRFLSRNNEGSGNSLL